MRRKLCTLSFYMNYSFEGDIAFLCIPIQTAAFRAQHGELWGLLQGLLMK